MSTPDSVTTQPPPADPVQRAFLALLPVVRGVAVSYFRDVHCPARRDDLVAEAVALAWAWHVRLVARGRDPAAFPVTLGRLAARAAACGRRVAGQGPARDVLAPACRRRHGFAVVPLGATAPAAGTELADALADNTRSPVPVQAQFRIDFPRWLDRLPDGKRRAADRLAAGHRTQDVAAEVGVTPARISQLRSELRRDYLSFLAGPAGE